MMDTTSIHMRSGDGPWHSIVNLGDGILPGLPGGPPYQPATAPQPSLGEQLARLRLLPDGARAIAAAELVGLEEMRHDWSIAHIPGLQYDADTIVGWFANLVKPQPRRHHG